MSYTGIPLDTERRTLSLVLGGDRNHPSFWLMTIAEKGAPSTSFLIRGDQKVQWIVADIHRRLYNFCSSNWLDSEFQSTEELLVHLIEGVRNVERCISDQHLSSEETRDAFLDITKALRVEITAAIFQFLQGRRPDAARFILEAFHRIGEDCPEWAVPMPT